jgi:hypothetical protein
VAAITNTAEMVLTMEDLPQLALLSTPQLCLRCVRRRTTVKLSGVAQLRGSAACGCGESVTIGPEKLD